MPRNILVLSLAFAMILTIPCTAGEIITLPLTLPQIPLYLGAEELLTFDAGQPLTDIIDARLHVTGSYVTYRIYCWQFGGFGGGSAGPLDPGLYIGFQEAETTLFLTRHVFERSEETQAFDLELGFDGGETPDWSFLASGAGGVLLKGLECPPPPAYPMICSCGPSAEVTEAFIVIEMDSNVPTEKSSWGSIKAIYR